MFNVKYEGTNEIFKVYSVGEESAGVKFLIFRRNKWEWVRASLFSPINEVANGAPTKAIEESKEREDINLGQTYWISKDKSRHEFKDMKTQHLLNAIKLLRREVPNCKGSPLYNGLSEEYFNR